MPYCAPTAARLPSIAPPKEPLERPNLDYPKTWLAPPETYN